MIPWLGRVLSAVGPGDAAAAAAAALNVDGASRTLLGLFLNMLMMYYPKLTTRW